MKQDSIYFKRATEYLNLIFIELENYDSIKCIEIKDKILNSPKAKQQINSVSMRICNDKIMLNLTLKY